MNFFNLYLIAFGSAFLTTLIALPFWRRWCLRTGLVDDPGHRKIHTEPVPLAGGLAVMTGLLVPTCLALLGIWMQRLCQKLLTHAVSPPAKFWIEHSPLKAEAMARLSHGLEWRALELAAILFGALGMLIVGMLDDKHELSPKTKFAAQTLVALMVAAAGVRITLFVPSVIFSYAITVLWILTVINAFNFMDNMNGLCSGLGAIGAFYFATVAGMAGQYLVALIASLTCGALIGFLPYNFPRAKSFLGDAGSHLVGYLLAVLAILPHFHTSKEPRSWAVLSPLLILAVPLGDMAWVVLLRTR
ncbi:MAG: undecaprenyl/decaprenyl-phosphate alpha-N-acetylglucosaminyl 1-phosphate transferase, partial [Akkermansiaceae bacterium]|nr:undecaprenyl/decaprenyl-phosphate alpha-N-acetylglucosaminyl 1-phosphate transferase [Verrucomicrobiales bacterium]